MTPELWQKIDELYHAARERGREVLVGADPEVRREVEALLAQDTARVGLLDRAPGAVHISAGTLLGPYRIETSIGKGGMGEVWKARDPRLNRDVAIKVSAHQFTDRFEREARAIAALNHPNICTLFDVGPNYLVMELVDGPTLAERITEGKIPLEEALGIAKQVADALESAHDKFIVHRDLKPANIKIKPDGKVKVLDFGLAKAGAEPETTSDSPTMMPGTQAGMILGTAGYMSPEQARGQTVDKRADIWAFGVVLYEMVTGRRLFEGPTVSDSLAAILTLEPDLTLAPAKTRSLLAKCLEKDPKKRLRDIGDAMLLLTDAPLTETPAAETPITQVTPASKWPWVVAAAFALGALALAAVHFREKPPAPPAVARFQVRLPEKVIFTTGAFTLSPDGRHVAFSAIGEDKVPRVWIQDLDSLEARVIRDTYTGSTPPPFFWSPDSRFVVYSENSDKLKKADVQTGALQDICDKPGPPIGGSWNNTGTIIFGSTSTGLWKVSAAGGKPAPLTVLDASKHERQHELPSFLPDGKHFLYLRVSTVPEETGIFAGSLDDPPERQSGKRILATGFGAAYARSGGKGPGRLLFMSGDNLMAQSFDLATLDLSGEPALVVRGVGSIYQTGYFSVSPDTLTYRTSASIREYQMTWFDRQGKKVGTAGEPGSIANLSISPDGTRAAYRKASFNLADQDIWQLDLSRDSSSRFTFGPGTSEFPVWSPDGSEMVYSSDRTGVLNLYRKPANGAQEETVLLQSNLNKRATSWTKDGKFLLYCTSPSIVFSDNQLWVLPMQGDRTPYPFLQTHFDQCGRLSPDGRWVAYWSNEGGRYDVYVREFVPSKDSVATGGKWLVSKDGGDSPAWRDDGKELIYVDRRTIMSVSIDTTHGFQAGTPQPLFEIPSGANSTGQTSDLKRFLVAMPIEGKAAQGFTVVLNWMSALKP